MKYVLSGMILWDYETRTWVITYKAPIKKKIKRKNRTYKAPIKKKIKRKNRDIRIKLSPDNYLYWCPLSERDNKKYRYM